MASVNRILTNEAEFLSAVHESTQDRMVSLKVSVILFTTLVFITEIQSQCTCKPGHPQDEVCKSDTVLRARIDSVRINQYDFRLDMDSLPMVTVKEFQYKITVRKVFKGNIKRGRPSYIFTPAGHLNCGASFDIGKVYLITGQLRERETNRYLDQKYRWTNRINVTSCQWVREWSEMSMFMRFSIKRRYLKNCDCQISQCGTINCPKATSMLWTPIQSPKDNCLLESGFCAKRNGNCCWKNTQRLGRCLRNNQ